MACASPAQSSYTAETTDIVARLRTAMAPLWESISAARDVRTPPICVSLFSTVLVAADQFVTTCWMAGFCAYLGFCFIDCALVRQTWIMSATFMWEMVSFGVAACGTFFFVMTVPSTGPRARRGLP